jgi:CDGSH-type Zn-finger protein/truncated hemoglobin YjbI
MSAQNPAGQQAGQGSAGQGSAGQGSAGQGKAGQGRLADVIATRGGLAEPEAPFVIEHREALIYMLCEAAELEHGIMCQYLFAAFSMKQREDEGLTTAELDKITLWRRQITHVATQEMLHLALVQNLLSAIGAAPHMTRPNLPRPAGHYPAGVQLALLPFGEDALRHFMYLERPEGMDLDDAPGLAAFEQAIPHVGEHDIVPTGQDFATVGHLYRSIELGFEHLTAKYGERWLFVGPPRAQATQEHFGWPELLPVTDLASARRAIEEILEQGEGPRGDWQDAHFGRFVAILDEYQQTAVANPAFDPVRPVIAANVRPARPPQQMPLITDQQTARITDLFNVGYEIMLQIFERFFAHTEETDAQLKALADATIALMFQVIEPLANLITTLPAGPEYPGRTAGPSFELFYENDYLMPHRDAAWSLLTERLDQAAALCTEILADCGIQTKPQLEPVATALTTLAATLATHLPSSSPQAQRAAAAARPPADDQPVLTRAAALIEAALPASGDLGPRLADGVLRPLSLLTTTSLNGGHQNAGPTPDAGPHKDTLWSLTQTATEIRAALGQAGTCPPELIEATAALQILALDHVTAEEADSRRARLGQLQAALPASVQASHNGPYLATNVPTVRNHLGEELPLPPQLALCRCGGSARKPFCDGSHASNGFTDAKDPNRVPDRRDTYQGEQVTIFDNRGLCQHAGYCTDRLAAVFRSRDEPFVAPSGGRLDEIIRAVRDCPSGALSLGLDGRESRDLADWGHTREPAIEITKDGPYRITGGIPVTGADGQPVPRNAGASPEHCALCRCGQSQNKPFCSGMHWYVDFRDPQPSLDPSLFEWSGGLPALTRMTRLLYEKLVPADPQLAAAFGNIPPGYPEHQARRLAESFGAPPSPAANGTPPNVTTDAASAGATTDAASAGTTTDAAPSSVTTDDAQASAGADARPELTEEQRARWVTLATQAATEAGLPADPPFRAALAAYLEWDSRQTQDASAPRWDWTAAGPPDTTTTTPDAEPTATPGPDVKLPGPDEPVSFEQHIRPLFRDKDRRSMSFAFDLWSADDVRTHAAGIAARLRDGTMPCDTTWPQDWIDTFQRWTDSGQNA